MLRRVLDDLGCERIVYLDHLIGRGAKLFEQVRALRGEGIVSKRRGRPIVAAKAATGWSARCSSSASSS